MGWGSGSIGLRFDWVGFGFWCEPGVFRTVLLMEQLRKITLKLFFRGEV